MIVTIAYNAKVVFDKIKAKGLEKLKRYCQICEKQCQDADEFKCHCMSETHQCQLQIYAQDRGLFVENWSEKFENGFLEHLRRRHGFNAVAANVVYDEYISDSDGHHVNISSTKWANLTEFVVDLCMTGKCQVKGTPEGWFITYNGEGEFNGGRE